MSIKNIIDNLNTKPQKRYKFQSLTDEDILNIINHKETGESWTVEDIEELKSRLRSKGKHLVIEKGKYRISE